MSDDAAFARIEAHIERRNELLARIDAHLERGITDVSPEHLARGAEFEARIEEHLARCTEVIAAQGQAYDDWRISMRQDSLRNERVLGDISQTMATSLARNTAAIDTFINESEGYRQALWAILDQLRGTDGPEPAAG